MEPAPKLTPILKRNANETYGSEKGGRRRVSFEPLELTGDRMRSDWPIMRKTPCNLPPRRSKAKDRGKKRRHSASPLFDQKQNPQQLGQNLRQVLSRENLTALYQPNHRYSPRTTKMMLAQCSSSKSPSPQVRKRKTIARTPPQHIPIMTREDRILEHVPKRHKTMITTVLSQLIEQKSTEIAKKEAVDDYDNRFDLNDCILWNAESASDVSMSDTSFSDASDQVPTYVPSSSPTSEISRTSDAAHLETIEEEADTQENTSPNVSPVRQHKRPEVSPVRHQNPSPSCSISPVRRSRDHTIPSAAENLDLDASVASNLLSSFDQVSGDLPASQSGTEEDQNEYDEVEDPCEKDRVDIHVSMIEAPSAVSENETNTDETTESSFEVKTAGASQEGTKTIKSPSKADVDMPIRETAVDEDAPAQKTAVDEVPPIREPDTEEQMKSSEAGIEELPTISVGDSKGQGTIPEQTAEGSPAFTESTDTTQESSLGKAKEDLQPIEAPFVAEQVKEPAKEEHAPAMEIDSEAGAGAAESGEESREVDMATGAATDVANAVSTATRSVEEIQSQVNPAKEGEETLSAHVDAAMHREEEEYEELADDMSSESDTVYDIVVSEGEGSGAQDRVKLEVGTLVPFYIEEGEGEWFWLLQLQKDMWLDLNDTKTVLEGLTYCEASGWNAYRLCSDDTRSIALNSCVFDSNGQLVTLTFKENTEKREHPSISSLHRTLIEQAAVPQMESSFRSE